MDRRCHNCQEVHVCHRCIKNTHICSFCGRMSHDCEFCGAVLDSLRELQKHQRLSKICKKARTMPVISLQDQLSKFGQPVIVVKPKET